MSKQDLADSLAGKTLRLTWTEGPTKGTTQEHVFYKNGTVSWQSVPASDKQASEADKSEKPEKPEYAAMQVTSDVSVFSYLSGSGYTLTAVLNFQEHSVVGFASSQKEWFPVSGRFEVVE